MKVSKEKATKAISVLLSSVLILGLFSETMPVYAEEAEPAGVVAEDGPTQYSEDGVPEESSSNGDADNNEESSESASQPESSQPESVEESSQLESSEDSSSEQQSESEESEVQPSTVYTTDSINTTEADVSKDLVVTSDAVSQISSSEDIVTSSGGDQTTDADDQNAPEVQMAKAVLNAEPFDEEIQNDAQPEDVQISDAENSEPSDDKTSADAQASSDDQESIDDGNNAAVAEANNQLNANAVTVNAVQQAPEAKESAPTQPQIPSFSTDVPTSISSSSYIATWKEKTVRSGSTVSSTMLDVSTNIKTSSATKTYSFEPLIDKVPMYWLITGTGPLYDGRISTTETTYYSRATKPITTTYTAYVTYINGSTCITDPPFADSSFATEGMKTSVIYIPNVNCTFCIIGYTLSDQFYRQIIPDNDLISSMISKGRPAGMDDVYVETGIINMWMWHQLYRATFDHNQWRWDYDDEWNKDWNPRLSYYYYSFTMGKDGHYSLMPYTTTYVDGITNCESTIFNGTTTYYYYNTTAYKYDGKLDTYITLSPTVTRAKLGHWIPVTTYTDYYLTKTQIPVQTTLYWNDEEEIEKSAVMWTYSLIYLPQPVHSDESSTSLISESSEHHHHHHSGGGGDISESTVQTNSITQVLAPVMNENGSVVGVTAIPVNAEVLAAAHTSENGSENTTSNDNVAALAATRTLGVAPKGGGHAVATGDESQMYLNLMILLSSAAALGIWLTALRKRSTR